MTDCMAWIDGTECAACDEHNSSGCMHTASMHCMHAYIHAPLASCMGAPQRSFGGETVAHVKTSVCYTAHACGHALHDNCFVCLHTQVLQNQVRKASGASKTQSTPTSEMPMPYRSHNSPTHSCVPCIHNGAPPKKSSPGTACHISFVLASVPHFPVVRDRP